jgi:hypothetical protein
MTVEPRPHKGYCRFNVVIAYVTGKVGGLFDINLCEALAIYATDFGYTIDFGYTQVSY